MAWNNRSRSPSVQIVSSQRREKERFFPRQVRAITHHEVLLNIDRCEIFTSPANLYLRDPQQGIEREQSVGFGDGAVDPGRAFRLAQPFSSRPSSVAGGGKGVFEDHERCCR